MVNASVCDRALDFIFNAFVPEFRRTWCFSGIQWFIVIWSFHFLCLDFLLWFSHHFSACITMAAVSCGGCQRVAWSRCPAPEPHSALWCYATGLPRTRMAHHRTLSFFFEALFGLSVVSVLTCAMDSRKQKRNEIWTYLNTSSWKSGNMDGAFPSTILAWHEFIVVYHGFPFSYCPVGWPWISISMSLNFAW